MSVTNGERAAQAEVIREIVWALCPRVTRLKRLAGDSEAAKALSEVEA